MCRNIKPLRFPDRPPTDEELQLAALQFVRKVTGYHTPSRANQEAFDRAVTDVSAAARLLFESLVVRAPASSRLQAGKAWRT